MLLTERERTSGQETLVVLHVHPLSGLRMNQGDFFSSLEQEVKIMF